MRESVVEEAALAWLRQLGYETLYGPDIAHDGAAPERGSYHDVLLVGRLEDALARLNSGASLAALGEALRRVQQLGAPALAQANRAFHELLVNGVTVETLHEGETRGELLWLVDWDDPDANDWLAVNQFTVIEGRVERRPDIVLFVNGLPLAVIELKNLADSAATIEHAYRQLQTYQRDIPRLFHYNELLVISDGGQAELGCLTTPRERFAAWKTIDGDVLYPSANLEIAIKGACERRRFLDLVRSFIVFEDDDGNLSKKVAQYHQFHAAQKALETTLRAAAAGGDGKGGVVWHTQGAGKSLTMLFFAGELFLAPQLANPTLVMLTDRTDLDDQLFGTFARGWHLLRQTPAQATSREHLRELLSVESGGVVFTTIQKFFPPNGAEEHPLLTARRNVIVMADEAHRSQYNLETRVRRGTGEFLRGFAQHMRAAVPHATFVAFTGTPLELADRDTRLVFGDYIDIYDVGRAIADRSTVPIYYESRLIKLDLPEEQRGLLDEEFEELTEDQEAESRNRLAGKWAQLEQVVGTPKRLAQVADDLVEHIERRQAALAGKVMIVCMSRRICADLYQLLAARRPRWHGADDEAGILKVVMTGSASDKAELQPHIRSKPRREELANRFKDPADPFSIVIVRDMWLTGFDAPSLHTIYVDKPMKGHALMQAVARVNRVFRDKPGGLAVDYLGIANNLKQALAAYVRADPDGGAPIANEQLDIGELVAAMLEQLELCREEFRGFSYDGFLTGSPSDRLDVLTRAEDFLYVRDRREPGADVVQSFSNRAATLLKAFALASATPEAHAIRTEVAFFQTLRAALGKTSARGGAQADDTLEHAVRQLVDQAIFPDGVVDIFAAAGLEKPDISILSDGFLAEIRDMPQRNLALEVLRKLLNGEISAAKRTSVVQSRRFSEKLEAALTRYHNRALETAQVIEALIELARDMRAAHGRGEELGLSEDELAFYDALGSNASAVEVLGDAQLRGIAREVADTVRNNTTIDWTVREHARANLRRLVRRVLRRHGYPPDQQEAATQLVIEQAELFAREETAAGA